MMFGIMAVIRNVITWFLWNYHWFENSLVDLKPADLKLTGSSTIWKKNFHKIICLNFSIWKYNSNDTCMHILIMHTFYGTNKNEH